MPKSELEKSLEKAQQIVNKMYMEAWRRRINGEKSIPQKNDIKNPLSCRSSGGVHLFPRRWKHPTH